MNIEVILAIMNTTELVIKIRPVWKKNSRLYGPEFFSGLISTTSSVVFNIVGIAFLLQP